MKKLSELDLTPGTLVCLHLSHGAVCPAPDLPMLLLRLAERQSKKPLLARPAQPLRGIREFLRHQTSVEWLTAAAKISSDEAEAIIRGFGIRVGPLMCHNAANPCRFLGVAAALAGRPDVLLYETAGMDPRGRYLLQEYVAEHGRELCAVHLSYPTRTGTGEPAARICPATARCVELSDNL